MWASGSVCCLIFAYTFCCAELKCSSEKEARKWMCTSFFLKKTLLISITRTFVFSLSTHDLLLSVVATTHKPKCAPLTKNHTWASVVVRAEIPATQQAEARASIESRSSRSSWAVSGKHIFKTVTVSLTLLYTHQRKSVWNQHWSCFFQKYKVELSQTLR